VFVRQDASLREEENISNAFLKYGGYKPNISCKYTDLKRVDPESRQSETMARAAQPAVTPNDLSEE
jgi:hypothetical protein